MKTNGNCYFDIPEILDIPYVHIILATAKYWYEIILLLFTDLFIYFNNA